MKKILALILLIIFCFTLSGCKNDVNTGSDTDSSSDNTSSNVSTPSYSSKPVVGNDSSISSEPVQSEPTSSSKPSSSSNNSTTSKPQQNDSPTVSTPSGDGDTTVNCEHSYKSTTVQHTCTEDGYTEFKCDLCGHSYKEDIVEAKHTFIEYICSECGMGDKQNVNAALSYWIKKNGEKSSVSIFEEYSYIVKAKPKDEGQSAEIEPLPLLPLDYENNGVFTVSSIWSNKEITFKFQSLDGKEVMEITLFDSENCSVNYINNDKMAAFEIKPKSQVLSVDSAIWNELSADEDFKILMKDKTESVLKYFEENLLVEALGFTLTDLGFIKNL